MISVAKSDGILADYVVMGVFGKHYNTWYLTQQEELLLLSGNSNVRLHVRSVRFDAAIGLYKLGMGDGGDSQMDVYRQVNLKDVVSIKGRLQTVED